MKKLGTNNSMRHNKGYYSIQALLASFIQLLSGLGWTDAWNWAGEIMTGFIEYGLVVAIVVVSLTYWYQLY